MTLDITSHSVPLTRSIESLGELYLLVFDIDDFDNQLFSCYKELNIQDNSSNPITCKVYLELGNSYNFCILANPDEQQKNMIQNLSPGQNRLTIQDAWEFRKEGKILDQIPMYGESGKQKFENETNLSYSISLTSMLARIDVNVALGTFPKNKFKLENIYLCNYNTNGYLVNSNTQIPHIPLNPGKQTGIDKAIKYLVSDATETAATFQQVIYAFESEKTETSTNESYYNSICLIVEGSFNGEANSFYRIDFMDENSNYMEIHRRNLYRIQITEVHRTGYKTLREAYYSYGVQTNNALKSHVITYDLADINQVVFDGEYLLGTNFQNGVLSVPGEGNTNNLLKIYTDHPDGYTVEQYYDLETSEKPDWLTLTPTGGTGIKSFTFNTTLNDWHTRQAKLILRAGRLRDTITIYQPCLPNCYILTPGQEVRIPVAKAYRVWKDYTGIKTKVNLTATPTAKLFWKDVEGTLIENQTNLTITGSGKDSYIRVKAGNITGNGVVTMSVSSVVRWSWHIWVVNASDIPQAVGGSGQYNLPWLDRNLGAMTKQVGDPKARGLVYQWGRKDPFPSTVSFIDVTPITVYDATNTPIPGLGREGAYRETTNDYQNLDNALKNPFTFYATGVKPYDWYTTISSYNNDNLWHVNNEKTVFDPCPVGYRVPYEMWSNGQFYHPWNGLLNQPWNGYPNGAVWPTHGGYYPETVTKNFGLAGGHEAYGYLNYWSAKTYNSMEVYGLYVNRSSNMVHTDLYLQARSSGYSVRCQRVRTY